MGEKLAKLLKTPECGTQLHGPSRPLAHSRVSEAEARDSGDWKIECDQATPQLRGKTNQHFQCIPFVLFKQKLQAKCKYYGIRFVEVEEAYTSQTCSDCGIHRKKHRKYRGLYICAKCGMVRNADINGALNILQVASESARIGSKRRVDRPVRIRLPTVVGR